MILQIMQAHKQEDGDKVGKRIASEANRRYILTPAVRKISGTIGSTSSNSGTASTFVGASAGGVRGGALTKIGHFLVCFSFSVALELVIGTSDGYILRLFFVSCIVRCGTTGLWKDDM